MKKSRLSILLIMIFVCALVSTNALALPDNSVLSQHINEADGTSGQNTNSGSGIKTGHIQNGAVTPSKIGFYRRVIVVAPSGGDFTSPLDAVNFITDASATNPYLVKIMPGVYNVGTSSVQMKEYVDMEGSGETVTKVTGGINGANNAEVRFLTFNGSMGNSSVSPKITNVTFEISGDTFGISNIQNSSPASPIITNVKITMTGGYNCYGVYNEGDASPRMDNVIINVSGCTSANHGVVNAGGNGSPTLNNVTITTAGNYSVGVNGGASPLTMDNVKIISDTIGVLNQATVTIQKSNIKAVTAINNYVGGSMNIALTQVDGAIGLGPIQCFGVYDANFVPVTCP